MDVVHAKRQQQQIGIDTEGVQAQLSLIFLESRKLVQRLSQLRNVKP